MAQEKTVISPGKRPFHGADFPVASLISPVSFPS
jgi:hypothetical protein